MARDPSTGSRREVIVFAGALYDSPLWTNRQHVATRLAARGWRVLYVEPRMFLLTILWRMLTGRVSLRRGLHGHLVRWHACPNLWVATQTNLLPGSRRVRWIGVFNHRVVNAWAIRWHAERLGFQQPVLLLYDTEAAEFLDDFPTSRVVYDCVDDHRMQAGASRSRRLVEREEKDIAARAAAIAVTTEPLRERFSHRRVALVPNAADVRAFRSPPFGEPPDIVPIPHPRIGTVGALDAYKVDVALLRTVAETHPTWQLVCVGPVDVVGEGGHEMEALQAFPNVHFLGLKRREVLPAYVHAFDVAVIPYRESAYNRASFPLKFWEFMASGKAVVASGLPALRPYAHLARLVSGPDEFSRAIDAALSEDPRAQAQRMDEALAHDWESRVDQIEELLTEPAGGEESRVTRREV